jgi:hypothetical protein
MAGRLLSKIGDRLLPKRLVLPAAMNPRPAKELDFINIRRSVMIINLIDRFILNKTGFLRVNLSKIDRQIKKAGNKIP